MIVDCNREPEVLETIGTGQWPERAEAELAAHVGACAVCRDVAEVALALRTERDEARREARVPSAAHVWWRAQMRARQEAAAAAERPIALAQGVAAASAAGLAVAAIGFGSTVMSWPDWLTRTRLSQLADVRPAEWLSIAAGRPEAFLALATAAAGLVLMPLAVYLVLSEE